MFSFKKKAEVSLCLTDDQVEELTEIFNNNKSRNGKLRLDKLNEILIQNQLHLDECQYKKYMWKLQLEEKAYISFPQFTNIIARKLLENEVEDQIRQLFRLFDSDSKGFITAEDMKNVMVILNPKISDEEIQQIVNQSDADEDGVLDYEQFVQMCLPR